MTLSVVVARSQQQGGDAPTVTEAPIHLPLGWNPPQSLGSPAVLWLHP